MSRPALTAIAGLLVIAIAIAMSVWSMQHDDQAPSPAAISSAPAPVAAPKTAPAKVTQPAAAPSFDVVRINPQGETVIAGRAMPKAEVIILDGGKEIGRVTADGRGEWVFLPEKPLEPGSRDLTLKATNPDGSVRESDAPVVLIVPDRDKDKGASLAVKVNPDGSVQILQEPERQTGAGTVSVAAVSYDDKGRLSVAGKAPPKAHIQLYLDGKSIDHLTADDQGNWRTVTRTELKSGNHIIRADEVGADGKVIARAEITFAPATNLPANGKITVEAGNSLWRIARKTYGSGYDFMVIYQANKAQIRDPNKIYPGQVFQVPVGR